MEKTKPNILAIVPARGGSKGLPRKNILDLSGKPLIAYSIESALESKLVDRVVVSTEDREIADIAVQWGAEVPFLRPAEMAGDQSLIGEAIQFTLGKLKEEGYAPAIVVTLFPTSPFRPPGLIDYLTEKALAGYGPVMTVTPATVHSHSLLVLEEKIDKDCYRLSPLSPSMPTRTFGRFNGLCLVSNQKGQNRPFVFPVRDPICRIDIDTEKDLVIARQILERKLWNNPALNIQ